MHSSLEAEAVAEGEGEDAGGKAMEQVLLAAALEERVVDDEAGEERLANVPGTGEGVGPVAQASDVVLLMVEMDNCY